MAELILDIYAGRYPGLLDMMLWFPTYTDLYLMNT